MHGVAVLLVLVVGKGCLPAGNVALLHLCPLGLLTQSPCSASCKMEGCSVCAVAVFALLMCHFNTSADDVSVQAQALLCEERSALSAAFCPHQTMYTEQREVFILSAAAPAGSSPVCPTPGSPDIRVVMMQPSGMNRRMRQLFRPRTDRAGLTESWLAEFVGLLLLQLLAGSSSNNLGVSLTLAAIRECRENAFYCFALQAMFGCGRLAMLHGTWTSLISISSAQAVPRVSMKCNSTACCV